MATTSIEAITSTAAAGLAIGRNGASNPVLQADCSVSSQATGVKVIGRAATAGADLVVMSSGTNENLKIDAKGSGTVSINTTATGAIALGANTSVTGTLGVSGNVAVNTDKFNVTAASGNTAVAGTLAVTGAATLSNTLAVTGNVAVNTNKFNVTAASGNTAIAGDVAVATDKFTVAAASGNTAIAGTLGVTGDVAVNTDKLTVTASSGAVVSASSIKSSSASAGIGYATGAGGTVTQGDSKTTGVTLSKIAGEIVMHDAELADAAIATFTVTNTAVAATDVIVVNHASVGTAGNYHVWVSAVASGSFKVSVRNVSGGALSQAIKLNFAVIKAVAA